MRRRWFIVLAVVLSSTMILLLQCFLLGRAPPNLATTALAAPLQQAPTVTGADPTSAPNDLDTPIVITGTAFVDGATVLLDGTELEAVEWVSATLLSATVPWGMDPGVYTVTVMNPGPEPGSLANAFTVQPGIGVWNAGELYGGAVHDLDINPHNPETLYAVSEGVGLFRTRDGGENWSLIYAGGVKAMAIDPVTSTTIYSSYGSDLLHSDDEGDSWDIRWLGPDTWNYVNWPHPLISGTVYASSQSGTGGLWRSEDSGHTWVTAASGLTDTLVTDMAFHPTDPLTMVVGTASGHLFRSTDGGKEWAYASTPVSVFSALAFNPWGAHELWVSDFCLGDQPPFTSKSANAHYTEWTPVPGLLWNPVKDIQFAPHGWTEPFSQTVFAAGCFMNAYKTTDGGDTWEDFGPETGLYQSIALHPTDPDTIYGSSRWEGVLKTTDGGTTWRVVQQGLTAVYPKQLVSVPGEPATVYAVTERPAGIYKATRGGQTWAFLDIEAVGDHTVRVVAVDPFTPTRVYAADRCPGGFAWRMHISEDAGDTWLPPIVISAAQQYSDCNVVFPTVLRADPAQAGALLAGVDHVRFGDPGFLAGTIYRSTDHGEHWTRMDVTEEIASVTDIAYDALTPAIVYAATGMRESQTGMYKSANGGRSWQRMGDEQPDLDWVESIAVEPSAPYRVFAWAQDYPDDGVYVSEDHGQDWNRAAYQCPNNWVEQLLSTDQRPPVLYAATAEGLFRTSDGAESEWTRAAGVLGQVHIYSLAQVSTEDRVILYAGTTGGFVGAGAAEAQGVLAASNGTLVNAGVYRYTTRRNPPVFIPLVMKNY